MSEHAVGFDLELAIRLNSPPPFYGWSFRELVRMGASWGEDGPYLPAAVAVAAGVPADRLPPNAPVIRVADAISIINDSRVAAVRRYLESIAASARTPADVARDERAAQSRPDGAPFFRGHDES